MIFCHDRSVHESRARIETAKRPKTAPLAPIDTVAAGSSASEARLASTPQKR